MSFCGAAERHGYGPQHVGGGLRGYARDKHGGPRFLIMGTEIVRSGWCEVEGLRVQHIGPAAHTECVDYY